MTQIPFDFAPFWQILLDAMRRDPKLAELMADPGGSFTAVDWQTPDNVGEESPSGHGSDRGVCATKGHLSVLMMENDPEEQYDNLPTLKNYCVTLQDMNRDDTYVRSVKMWEGTLEVLIGQP